MKGFWNRARASERLGGGRAWKLLKQFPIATVCLHRAGSPVLMREQGTGDENRVLMRGDKSEHAKHQVEMRKDGLRGAGRPMLMRWDRTHKVGSQLLMGRNGRR